MLTTRRIVIAINQRFIQIVNKYTPYKREDEVKTIAKITVELGELSFLTLGIELNIGYGKMMTIAEELERLKIIGKTYTGHYMILAKLEEIDDIFDNDPIYQGQQQSLF